MNMLLKLLCLVVLLSSYVGMTVNAAPSTTDTLVKEGMEQIEIQAIVKSIDQKTRQLTLMGPNGNLLSITAGDDIKRLNEIKVGDIVTAEYKTYIAAEFRKPTPEEEENPLTVVAAEDRAPKDMNPGAAVGAIVRAVVSIEIINLPSMEVTIKGPRGNYVTIPVEDDKLIREIRVGQRLVMTYAEALVIKLDKVK